MKRAFTLIEIMVSLAILGLGIVITFNLLPLAWQALSYSRKLNEVSYLAQETLEELKAQGSSVTMGETSGKQGDLNWKLTVKPLVLADNVEVVYAELNIDFLFQLLPQKQKFVTYLYKE